MNAIVTGGRDAGKTTTVRRVAGLLEERGLDPVGFYTAGGPETLELVSVRTGDRTVFASRSAELDGPRVGRYAVDRGAIERGLAWADEPGDVLLADEIGKLERRGEGFAPLLETLRPDRYRGVLLSVRQGLAPFAAEAFPPDARPERFEVTPSNREDLPARIADLLVET
ncbi:MAG: nucleoside-triphosphatase [Halobacteriales archaeon]